MRANDGAWIGWPGDTDDDLEPFDDDGLQLVPVHLSAQEVEEFYEGFSNATLWPLYHDLVAKPEFHREWWDSYVTVNRRFAEKAAEVAAEGATVWVQDYQLQLVPQMLRELRPDLRIGFYLHIPFPPAELFSQLPWRRQILEGLLGADLVGFQLAGGAGNFVRLVRQRVGHKTHRDLVYLPDGRLRAGRGLPDLDRHRGLRGAGPLRGRAGARRDEIREALGNPRKVFLGIDRLDYTKGIYARLRAFSELIADGELDVEDAVFVQVATPVARAGRAVPHPARRHRPAGRAASTATSGGSAARRSPTCTRPTRARRWRRSTAPPTSWWSRPFRDGMNLVAKEYVACRYDDDGALVLSEFAGAADELRQAWLVNPYDINGMKAALLEAYHAEPEETARRMRAMRKTVVENDVAAWAARSSTSSPPGGSSTTRRSGPPAAAERRTTARSARSGRGRALRAQRAQRVVGCGCGASPCDVISCSIVVRRSGPSAPQPSS